jgi:hypothetical protein
VTHPASDDSFARLKAAGWSVGEVGTATGWTVYGTNGENVLRARGPSLAEAYRRACAQAELCGMLRPARHRLPPR